MEAQLPFSQACENNKEVILDKLRVHFSDVTGVLEIGSGTGQHAVHFATHMPHLLWFPTDRAVQLATLNKRLGVIDVANIQSAIAFSIGENEWPSVPVDGVFSANTAHIMQPNEVECMMGLIAENLPENGVFCQYGPFTQGGEFISESNKAFHHHLLAQGYGGYRDISELKRWASGLTLSAHYTMPANNELLIWVK
nr:DUF938 domain-containing protein [Alteromonas facilis]